MATREYWEFLLQQEGDQAWLSLDSPEMEIQAGRYRLIARSSHQNVDLELRMTHETSFEDVPKRRTQKRSLQTNADGFVLILPFTQLQPGTWVFTCNGDLLSDFLGESWQHGVRLQVLPEQPESLEIWDPEPAEALEVSEVPIAADQTEITPQLEDAEPLDEIADLTDLFAPSENPLSSGLTSAPIEPIEPVREESAVSLDDLFGDLDGLGSDDDILNVDGPGDTSGGTSLVSSQEAVSPVSLDMAEFEDESEIILDFAPDLESDFQSIEPKSGGMNVDFGLTELSLPEMSDDPELDLEQLGAADFADIDLSLDASSIALSPTGDNDGPVVPDWVSQESMDLESDLGLSLEPQPDLAASDDWDANLDLDLASETDAENLTADLDDFRINNRLDSGLDQNDSDDNVDQTVGLNLTGIDLVDLDLADNADGTSEINPENSLDNLALGDFEDFIEGDVSLNDLPKDGARADDLSFDDLELFPDTPANSELTLGFETGVEPEVDLELNADLEPEADLESEIGLELDTDNIFEFTDADALNINALDDTPIELEPTLASAISESSISESSISESSISESPSAETLPGVWGMTTRRVTAPPPAVTSDVTTAAEIAQVAVTPLPPLTIELQPTMYNFRRGEILMVYGQVVPERLPATIAHGELVVKLINPQTSESVAEFRQSLRQQSLPFAISATLPLETDLSAQLLIGEVAVWDDGVEELAQQTFTATAHMDDLIAAIDPELDPAKFENVPRLKVEENPLPPVDFSFFNLIGQAPADAPEPVPLTKRESLKDVELPDFSDELELEEVDLELNENLFSVDDLPLESIADELQGIPSAAANQDFRQEDDNDVTLDLLSAPSDDITLDLSELPPHAFDLRDISIEPMVDDLDADFQLVQASGDQAFSDLESSNLESDDLEQLLQEPAQQEGLDQELDDFVLDDVLGADALDPATSEIVVDDLPEALPKPKGQSLEANPLLIPESEPIPVPILQLDEQELVTGQAIRVKVKLPNILPKIYVKLWINDRQSRTLLDGPRWLVDFVPNGRDELEAVTQLTVPFGSLEIQIAAIAVEASTKRESYRTALDRAIISPDLEVDLSDFDLNL